MPEQLSVNLTPLLPGWTYGEIVEYFAERFDDEKPHIRTMIKQVLNEIVARWDWKWLHASSVVTTESGVSSSPLEADLLQLDTEIMVIVGSSRRSIYKRPLGFIRDCQAGQGAGSGTPQYFADTGDGNVEWWPTPSSEFQILYDYTKYVSDDINDDSVPPIPRHWQHVLISGVEEIMRMDDDREDGATNLARRKFEKQLLDMIWREESGELVRSVPDILPPDVTV
ncbi:MAG: hypothetical protein E2O95_04195 [Acidobacteria bacterium]|nr:MAG: hypothetical protein E2O95_04195 [Acidobacteriota bacterium]